MRENSTHAAEQTVGHVPDTLGEVLFQSLADGNITVSANITGQSRSAQEGTWAQRGGLEIPCFYEVFVKQALPELKNSPKRNCLRSIVMLMEQLD